MTSPGSPTTHALDPEIECGILLDGRSGRLSSVLSNSFGFGGSNCALVFGRLG